MDYLVDKGAQEGRRQYLAYAQSEEDPKPSYQSITKGEPPFNTFTKRAVAFFEVCDSVSLSSRTGSKTYGVASY